LKMRTVVAPATICRGCESARRTLDRHSPFVASLPSSIYTRASSKIRSSARLSLRDSASDHACSRARTAVVAPPLPPSCAGALSNIAQTRTANQPVVLIRIARMPQIPGHAEHRARTLVAGKTYHAGNRDPLPILVEPGVHETLPPRVGLVTFYTLRPKIAAHDCGIAMQMHHHRFRQNL